MVWQCVEIFNSFFPNSILMHETWQCRKDTYYILVVTDQIQQDLTNEAKLNITSEPLRKIWRQGNKPWEILSNWIRLVNFFSFFFGCSIKKSRLRNEMMMTVVDTSTQRSGPNDWE